MHVGNVVIHGIRTVFPPNVGEENNPILLKKLRKLGGMWALQKEILRFEFDGLKKIMWLASDKRDTLLTILKSGCVRCRESAQGSPSKSLSPY